MGGVDRLSKKMRERIGESLKSIRKTEPLEQVTTASIAALRRYTQASRLFDRGKYGESIPLLEDAIRLDSTFAMAYRRLAVAFYNIRGPRSGEIQAAREAFRYRHRRSEEHTSELQSLAYLVCRLLLEKKNNTHVTL